jgi:hypothetical protein
MRFRIRYNKTAGQPGRGSKEHVWRVFDESNKEYICKHIFMKNESWGEKEELTPDYNIVTNGEIQIDKEKSLITII